MKKNIKILMLFIIMFCISIIGVRADNEYVTEITNQPYKITVDISDSDIDMKLSTVTGQLDFENNQYFVFLSNDSKPTEFTSSEEVGCNISSDANPSDMTEFKFVSSNNSRVHVSAGDWYILVGYEKAYVVRRYKNETDDKYYCELATSPITLEKPLPDLDKRYYFNMQNNEYYNYLSVFADFPHPTTNIPLTLKIGIINDNQILSDLANNKEGALDALLSYAKQSTNAKTYTLGTINTTIDNGFDLEVVDGKYYFLYVDFPDESTYRNLDGIAVTMAEHGILVTDFNYGKDLTDTSNDIVMTEKKLPKNPSTGVESYIAIVLIALLTGTVMYIKSRRYNEQ